MSGQSSIRKKVYSDFYQDLCQGFGLSRTQVMILEQLPLNPRAGAIIAPRSLFNARMIALENGIEQGELTESMNLLVSGGYLEKTRNCSYKLTALGAHRLFSTMTS